MRRLVIALALVSAGLITVPAAATAAPRTPKVVRWVDGDTVVTTIGRVRLIGVDTPEVGECGAAKATRLANRLAPVGSHIQLRNPSSVDDEDRYGRMLRYVDSDHGWDVSLRQIKAGAWARYDSNDGYDHHPRQRAYRAADRAHRNYCGNAKPSGDPKTPAHHGGGHGGSLCARGRCGVKPDPDRGAGLNR